jgi:hypothetical protein
MKLKRSKNYEQYDIQDYRQVWLERNRPGGLADSVAHLEKARF